MGLLVAIRFWLIKGVYAMKFIPFLKSLHAVFLLLLGLSAAIPLVAKGGPVDFPSMQLAPQEQGGITYLAGGIGSDESEAIKNARGYNLHMTFSQGLANEYEVGVDVDIQKPGGGSVLSLSKVGPLVYVNLPVGRYVIAVNRDGRIEKRRVMIERKSTRNVNFHWE